MNYNLIEKGIYKHFKGGQYTAICLADDRNCETYVVYVDSKGNTYARPIRMFFEKLSEVNQQDAKQPTRFTYTGKTVDDVKFNPTEIKHTEEDIYFKLCQRESGCYILIRK